MTKSCVDLLIHHIGQLATPLGRVSRAGGAMNEIHVAEDVAIAIHRGEILAVGQQDELTRDYAAEMEWDAKGHAVIPGLVDCHTHVVWAGSRTDELEQRLAGAEYLDILKQGGGILSTVRATRDATPETLVDLAKTRLRTMLQLGTTTAEVKTGYGLSIEDELKMLAAIEMLHDGQPVDLIPTFLGAHAVPPEFRERPNGCDEYMKLVVGEMLPAVARWYEASSFKQRGVPCFHDVFCEKGAFDAAQSRKILTSGKEWGLPAKIHTEEFTSCGGVRLAVELNAVSADHLDVITAEDRQVLAQSETIGVVMPAVNFQLGSADYADGRAMIDAGCRVALATDINPGSAPCPSMQMVMAMACRYNGLTIREALTAATLNAACAVSQGDSVGSIEPGKKADLLILNTKDWRDVVGTFGGNQVATVIKSGKVI